MENYGYISAMKKYATFSGRSSRKEFWMFQLIYIIIAIVAAILDVAIASSSGSVGFIGIIVGLVHFLPGIAAGVRRLHDTNRSGWLYLLFLIPIIGSIILLIWWCQRSNDGINTYGPNPYSMENSEVFD